MSLETHPDLDDELTRLAEVPPPTDDVLDRVRAQVRQQAVLDLRRVRARRTRRRASYVVTLAAAAVAVVVVLGGLRLDVGGQRVVGPSAAAAVLERAAAATLAQQDPVVPPGKFLRVRYVNDSWTALSDEQGRVRTGRDGQPAVALERFTRTTWIPADIDQEWVVRRGSEVLRRLSSDERVEVEVEPESLLRSPSWARHGSSHYVHTWDPRWYDGLSTDPQTLLRQLRLRSGAEGGGTSYDFSEVYSEVLRSPLAPARVRAAVFAGLADRPDMQVVEDVATLDGRTGTAIGARGAAFQMVFDDQTGLFIGERADNPVLDDLVPADGATYLTAITTDVVDRAPAARDRVADPG